MILNLTELYCGCSVSHQSEGSISFKPLFHWRGNRSLQNLAASSDYIRPWVRPLDFQLWRGIMVVNRSVWVILRTKEYWSEKEAGMNTWSHAFILQMSKLASRGNESPISSLRAGEDWLIYLGFKSGADVTLYWRCLCKCLRLYWKYSIASVW